MLFRSEMVVIHLLLLLLLLLLVEAQVLTQIVHILQLPEDLEEAAVLEVVLVEFI